jgi:hypothetical protein
MLGDIPGDDLGVGFDHRAFFFFRLFEDLLLFLSYREVVSVL